MYTCNQYNGGKQINDILFIIKPNEVVRDQVNGTRVSYHVSMCIH